MEKDEIVKKVIDKLNRKNNNLSFVDIAREEQIRYNKAIVEYETFKLKIKLWKVKNIL